MTKIETPLDLAAIRLANAGDAWRPYLYRLVPEIARPGQKQRVHVTGCDTDTVSRGPTKGRVRFLTKQNRKTVVITRAALSAAEKELSQAGQNGCAV